MLGKQRSAANSIVRSVAYIRANPQPLGVLEDTPDFKTLDAAIPVFAQIEAAQATAPGMVKANQAARKQLEQQLRAAISKLATFARSKRKTDPAFGGFAKTAGKAEGRKLVAFARAMIDNATPSAAAITAAKFPADFLSQMAQMADQLEQLLNSAQTSRSDRATNTATLKKTLADSRTALASIDPIVRHLLGDSPALAGWKLARQLRATPAPAVTPVAAATTGTSTTSTGTVSPASTVAPTAAAAPHTAEVAAG